MTSAYLLLVVVHVLLFAYWLGADWGVYVTSRYVADAKLSLEERRRFLQAAFRIDLLPRISFTLLLPVGVQLAAYYGAADVCAVPSYYESFGLVALESMACGTPVVATRAGGLTSTVRDGVNGYLIPWRSPEAFAERIGVLLADPALRAGMSDAARGTARRFRWSEVGADLDRLFARLCRAHRQARLGCHVGGGSLVMGGAAGAHERCHARESR